MSVMSCQIALYPLDSLDSTEVIRQVLEQMDWQEVTVDVGSMSTVVRGEETFVWEKLRQLYALADASGRFAMSVLLSNHCGCKA